MIFPNASMSFAGLSAANPVTDYAGGWTSVYPHYGDSEPSGTRFGVVEACTATNREIEDRSAGGEFSFDVIDEHMSRLWFRDRDSFRMAWRLARQICKGRKVEGIPSRELVDIHHIDGQPVRGLTVEASAHHIAETARPADYSEFIAALVEHYKSPQRPPFSVSYRLCHQLAAEKGWAVPSLSHARRLVRKEAA